MTDSVAAGGVPLSEHFSLHEFTCKCGCKRTYVEPELIDLLEKIREHFGRPVIISSGYRCPKHNKAVGGGPNSQHIFGKAADINVIGVSPAKVQQFLADHEGGLGAYLTFTHVDVRGRMARWKGETA